jgi:nitrite reductase (NADH) large subunit
VCSSDLAKPEAAITLITEESYPLYNKPRLFDLLEGSVKEKELFLSSDEFYRQKNILFLKECKVSAVNTLRKQVYFKNKREVAPYDLLVICTGRKFILPEIPGVRKNGVASLYSLTDFKAFISQAIGDSICVVGANVWAVAASRILASRRKDIKLINSNGCLTEASRGLISAEVEVINSRVTEIIGESEVQAIKLIEGKIIGTHAVVFMDDLRSNTDFFKNMDIEMSDGAIVVDEKMRTNLEGVFACGTVCRQSATGSAAKSWDEVISESRQLASHLIEAIQG